MGIPVLPHDALVSPAARERWLRWRSDLKSAERKARKQGSPPQCWKIRQNLASNEEQVRENMRRQHEQSMLEGNPYTSQPLSPLPSEDPLFFAVQETTYSKSEPFGVSAPLSGSEGASWPSEPERSPTPDSSMSDPYEEPIAAAPPHTVAESSRSAFINSTQKVPTLGQLRDKRASRGAAENYIAEDIEMTDTKQHSKPMTGYSSARKSWGDGSEDSDEASSATTTRQCSSGSPPAVAVNSPLPETPIEKQVHSPTPRTTTPLGHVKEAAPLPPVPIIPSLFGHEEEDKITDTVGAIAVDSWGNIACGASSGGIGMKYRGRVGPAALVGVGAAIIPIDPDDQEQTCVGTVTSGTGEHMATTMAATVCAERLYQSVRKGKAGIYEEVTEDEALKAMIENEFMGKTERYFDMSFY
jgi:taspase (threonine aspartase 1)